MQIWNVMTPNVATASPKDKLSKAYELMQTRHFRRLPVVEEGKLIAIVTDRDVRQHWGYLDSTLVSAAMTADPLTISPNVTVEDATRLMLEHQIGGLPVVDNGKLIGIVTSSDVMKAFLRMAQATLDVIKR